MCGSMVDIQSPTAEIRQGKKKKERRKIEIIAAKYNGLPITVGGHNKFKLIILISCFPHKMAPTNTVNLLNAK